MNKIREKEEAPSVSPRKSGRSASAPSPTAPLRSRFGRSKERSGAGALPRALISVMNGSFLTREKVIGNMPFILFCAGLMLCYIAYGYWTERTVRDLDKTNTELKEMRSEYLTVRSHLEQAQQQSHVAGDISTLGLKESKTPPMRMTVDEDHLETTAHP